MDALEVVKQQLMTQQAMGQQMLAVAAKPHLQRQLEKQQASMVYDALLTQMTIEGIGRNHSLAAFEYERARATAEVLRRGREGQMTELDRAVYERRDAQLAADLEAVVREANRKLLERLEQAEYRPSIFDW